MDKSSNNKNSHEFDTSSKIYTDFKKSEFATYLTELSLIYKELNDAIKNLKKWSKQNINDFFHVIF